MAISFEMSKILHPEIGAGVESVIRKCIGDRPMEEDWKISIYTGISHCRVVVEGPTPTREQWFFGDVHTLPAKIRSWLDSYPFR